MDLKDFVPTKDTILVRIKHPSTFEPFLNDDGSEQTITLWAPHSKEYKSVVHEQTNIRLQKMQAKGGRKAIGITAEEIEADTIKMLAKTTKEWNVTFDKVQPELTVDAAKEIYSQVFWIKSQIEEALEESDVFTPA
jgi:hypothetical protein